MKTLFLLFLIAVFALPCIAQKTLDSLDGFDETAALKSALSEDYSGLELDQRLAQLMHMFVAQKYYWTQVVTVENSRPVNPGCVNEDFEASQGAILTSTNQITGWVCSGGYLNASGPGGNNCSMLGCCPNAPSQSTLIATTSGFIDSDIGPQYPIFSVFGNSVVSVTAGSVNPQLTIPLQGNNCVKLNANTNGDYSIERLETSFSVTAANSLYAYAFIAVLQPGHGCCDATAFQVIIRNLTTNSIVPGGVYATALGGACNNNIGIDFYDVVTGLPASSTSASAKQFNKWKVVYVDLSPYIGQVVQVQALAGDCSSGGHTGSGFFDSQCGTLNMLVNASLQSSSCRRTATISASSNLNAYNWTGPNGFTTNAASFTTQVPGVYTLQIPQGNAFPAIQRTLNLTFQPAIMSVTTSNTLVCQGSVITLSATGLSTYTWSTGSIGNSTTVQAVSYATYTVKGTDASGCEGIDSIVVSVKPCTGIDEQSMLQSHLLFPNPGMSPYTLESPFSAMATLRVYDALGQMVHEQIIIPGKNEVYLQELNSSIFYYQLNSENGRSMHGKLVLQH